MVTTNNIVKFFDTDYLTLLYNRYGHDVDWDLLGMENMASFRKVHAHVDAGQKTAKFRAYLKSLELRVTPAETYMGEALLQLAAEDFDNLLSTDFVIVTRDERIPNLIVPLIGMFDTITVYSDYNDTDLKRLNENSHKSITWLQLTPLFSSFKQKATPCQK